MAMFEYWYSFAKPELLKMVIPDALVLNDTIKTIGEDKFNRTALDEAKVDMAIFIPCFMPCSSYVGSHWFIKQYNIEVQAWDQLYGASKN